MSDAALRDLTSASKGRQRRARAPIHTTGGRPPTAAEFATARRMVEISGVLEPLRAQLDHADGRPRSLSVEGLLVAMQVNALRRHHAAEIVEVARVLNTFSARQLDELEITDWNAVEAYDRTDRLFNLLDKALKKGWDAVVDSEPVRIDADWFFERWLRASLVGLPATSSAVAIDGTDIETWGRLHGQLTEDDLDGEADLGPAGEAPPKNRKRTAKQDRRVRVFGTDENGRNIYTQDPDARAHHRSADERRKLERNLHDGAQQQFGALAVKRPERRPALAGGAKIGDECHVSLHEARLQAEVRDKLPLGRGEGLARLLLDPDRPEQLALVANGHDLVRQPLGRLRERRRARNLVELCVEPGGDRIGEARQRLITVLVDEPY
jgi:hypothetical protein